MRIDWQKIWPFWPYATMIGLTCVFLYLVALLLAPVEHPQSGHKPPVSDSEAVVEPEQHAVQPKAETPSQTSPTPVAEAAEAASKSYAPLTPMAEDSQPLPLAPDPAVTEDTPKGALPAIAGDGRKPWQVYARPFTPSGAPSIAVVVASLGADKIIANTAISRLPSAVTLVIDALAPSAGQWLKEARAAGHETILSIPAEPLDFPASDPGPGLLLANQSGGENIRRLQAFLRKGTGYIGLTVLSGSRFVTLPKALSPILDEVERRGLAILDARLSERSVLSELAQQRQLPVAAIDLRIGAELAAAEIDRSLAQAERQARQAGKAVFLVVATPLAIDRLNHWLSRLPAAGIRVAPLSAVLH